MAEIQLRQRGVTLVDDGDLAYVAGFDWYLDEFGYVARWDKDARRTVRMHRQLMQPSDHQQVDHINGDGLDNRRSVNLRIATASQNQANRRMARNNRSGFKGVYFHTRSQKFIATVMVNGKRIEIGSFDDPADAARAYDDELIRRFGEFALTNLKIRGSYL